MTERKTRTKYPLESFGPELLELLRRVGRGETLAIPFKTRRLAKTFQRRIWMLKNRLREADHELWPIASRVRTSIRFAGKADEPETVTLHPYDSEFKEAISAIGVEAPKLDHDPLEDV